MACQASLPISPGICSKSYPLSCWCYPIISSSIALLFSCLQSFLASRSLPMSWLFASSSQSTGASGSVLIVPMNTQGWFSLGLTGLISLQSKELSKGFSSTTIWKHQFGRSQDGGGIGRGDHFLFYKFIERTTERWRKFTKQLLIASRGHQAPRKAAHCLWREVGQKY